MISRSHLACAILLALATADAGTAQTRVVMRPAAAAAAVLQQPAALSVDDVSLKAALLELSRTSQVPIAFSPSAVSRVPIRVSCACERETVGGALDRLLSGTRFSYQEVNDQVMIFGASPVEAAGLQRAQIDVRLARMPAYQMPVPRPAWALPQQETFVAGTVVDARSLRPLSGVQVLVVGTQRGAVTDARGRFRIEGVTGREVTLHVTMLGYGTIERTVRAGDADVRLALEESAVALDALVVTGTPGAVQRRSIGNAVAQLSATEVLSVAPVQSVGEMLGGRVAGVIVTPPSGMAGAGGRIDIRGRTSISLASDPLIYIDGIRVSNEATTGPALGQQRPISRLADINPEDIEHIEVIKGPAAATLYGTEASNGVIQIITKKGGAGRPTVDMRMRQGTQWFADAADVLGSSWGVDPGTGQVIEMNLVRLEEAAGRDVFTPGHMQGYGASVRGGADAIRYYLGVDYDRDHGVEPTNKYSRLSTRGNLAVALNDRLDVSANLGLTRSRVDLSPDLNASLIPSIIFGQPAFLNTPKRGFFTGPPEVMWDIYDNVFQTVGRVTGGLRLDHRPLPWLTQRLTVGLDLTSEGNQAIVERQPEEYAAFVGAQVVRGSKNITFRDVSYTTVEYNGTAQFDIGSVVSSTSAGAQYYRNFTEFTQAMGQDFPTPDLKTVSAAAVTFGADDFVENATVGVFMQQQLAWHNRLFLTGAVRADDNSAFGQEFDLVYYPKLSAAWVVNEEPFWRIPLVDALRLRGAYGQSGQQPQAFAALRSYLPITGPGNLPAVTPQFLGNPNLAPERGVEYEVGFDAGLFGSRLGLDFTYYHQTTRDAILLRDVAPSTGFAAQQFVNAGSVRNKGIELRATALPLDTRRVDLELGVNIATNDNEILDLGGLETIVMTYTRHQEGHPIASFFGRRVVSADRAADGRPTNVLCDGGPNGAPVPCGQAPAVFLGGPTPRLQGAVTAGLTLYDRVRLHGMVDFKRDFYKWDVNGWARCAIFQACELNFFPERFNPVDVAQVEVTGGGIDAYVADASFTKLRELSASLILPDRWAAAFGASRASIMLSARNLRTWTRWPGMDPEVVFTAGVLTASYDQAQLPQLRQFVTTIAVTF